MRIGGYGWMRFGTVAIFLVSLVSVFAFATITRAAPAPNPRQQVNKITAFIDGSVIYGSDPSRAAALRAFSGGRLKTSAGNLLPFNTQGLPNANDAHLLPDSQLFLAGDVRANENIELISIQTLFVREHNRIADAIAQKYPRLPDEAIYQRARRVVIAELQVITYKEFLPAFLGQQAMPRYNGYSGRVNPEIANEFSTAAYRIGHTLVGDDVEFLANDGTEIRPAIPLSNAFFNPTYVEQEGIDPVLKYLATDDAQEVDLKLVESLRNFLFGPPGSGGFDLVSLNIQRGRDHGLPDYNSVRRAYGLPGVTDFNQITTDVDVQNNLRSLYGTVDNIDLWVGGLAEPHVADGSVGPTFTRIIADQFRRLRDGDRYWYERIFSGAELAALDDTRLSDVLRRNTTITNIQDNVFFYDELSTQMRDIPVQPYINKIKRFINDKPLTSVQPIDGTGNNITHQWGVAGADLLRLAGSAYGDGISTPAGASRPSPRLISNTLSAQPGEIINSRWMSAWVYAWGQFIDHDLDLTDSGNTAFNIAVPSGDSYFDPTSTGTKFIPFNRSNFNPQTGR